MDFWDGWKLSYLTQAFTNQPASLTGMDMGSAKEIASGKTPYSSSYRSASFTEQTLVWEALALSAQLKDFVVEEMQDRSKIMRWRETVEETKKLSITSLDQLEVGRDYKTEQGIPIKRLPTNELDLAGKILLKILPQLDGRTGVTLLKAYFAEGTGKMAIESFSMLTFNEGIGIALHRKDVDKVAAQDVFLVFSLEEIPLDQKYVVAPRERKGEVEAGERRIKIKRISVKDVYISYRRRELVVGGKLAAEARAGLNLGSMVGVLNRELKLNFNMAGNMGHMGTGGGHLALGGVRKKIDFSSMGSAGSASSALASPASPSRASSPASRKTVDPSSPSAGTKRKIDDKENEPNGAMASSPSRGSPARGSALTPVKSSTSPAKRARPSPLRVKLEQATAPAASSPLASSTAASASVIPSSSVAPPSASVAPVLAPVSASLPSAVAHVPARVASRTKPRPSVSMGLLDLLPTPPPAAAVASAPPAAAAPAPVAQPSVKPPTSLPASLKPAAAAPAPVSRRQPMTMKPVSATQGLKDLFAPAPAASGSAGASGSANSDLTTSTRSGSISALPFSYIPYATIDPSALAAKAAAAAATGSATNGAPAAVACGSGPLPPPPPPPPAVMSAVAKRIQEGKNMARKKMRTLHWSIIPKDKLGETVWKAPEMVDSPGIDLDTNELESMFSLSPDKKAKGESKQEEKKGGIRGKKHSPLMELLNLQRVNNIGILLSQFKVPLEEVIGAIWRMDESALSLENLKALRYIAPKDDEIKILRTVVGKLDMSLLTKAERFLLMLVEVPRLSQRLESFLWKRQFPTLLAELAADTACLLMACDEVKTAKKLPQILKIVLTIGQVLNRDSYLFNSDGFKLESLMRLTETKGKNTQFTILHFLKKEVQTKKEHLLSFYDELPNVEKASKLCMEHIIMEVQKIKKDLTQLERELAVRKEEKDKLSAEQPPAPEDHYCELMGAFFEDAKLQFERLAGQVDSVLAKWNELARFYGEDADKAPPQQFFSCLHHFAHQFHSLKLPAAFLEGKVGK